MEFKCGSKKCKRRGGGRVQGFLEEDTFNEVIAIFKHFHPMCYITVVFRLIHGFTCAGILPGSSSAPRLYFLMSLMSSVSSHCMVL